MLQYTGILKIVNKMCTVFKIYGISPNNQFVMLSINMTYQKDNKIP